MPKIVEAVYYNGAKQRTERLGLAPLIDKIEQTVTGFLLLVTEEKDANGGAPVLKMVDKQFESEGGCKKNVTGEPSKISLPRPPFNRLTGPRRNNSGRLLRHHCRMYALRNELFILFHTKHS
jgi:hypothetical protein